MTPHEHLPASYLASCEEFFKWLKDCRKNGFKAPSSKLQAPSSKRHEKDTIKMYKLVWLIGVLPGQAENTATQKEIL